MTIDFNCIHAQFHASKQLSSPLILDTGPFTCYLHPETDSHYENYAIPNIPDPETVPGAIPMLVKTFHQHHRRPRLEYIEACAPGLETALEAAGFRTESRSVVMVCTVETLRIPDSIAGLTLSVLGPEGSLEDYRDFKTVETRSFWQADAPESTLKEAAEARRRFGSMLKILARMDNIPVGVGSLTFPHKGVGEAAGIATLPPYRRRGIAGVVTAALCAEAFRQGISLIFLTAADEGAGRVYLRAGFSLTGTSQVNSSHPA